MRNIEYRAKYEAVPSVVLVAKAVAQLADKSGDTIVETHHLATPSGLTKNMITNASFRTKKLEGDIPIVEKDHDAAERDFAEKMGMIPEDVEAEVEKMNKLSMKEQYPDTMDGGKSEKISEKLKAKMEDRGEELR